MSEDTSKVITLDDFKDYDSIDSMIKDKLDNEPNENDDNGYTPLCFAALNSIEPRFLYYLIEGKDWPGKHATHTSKLSVNADVNESCAKGKKPLQLACIAMNTQAVDLFIGESVRTQVLDKNGNPIQDITNEGYPAYIDKDGNPTWRPTDADGNANEIKYVYEDLKVSKDNVAKIDRDNGSILAAAALPNGDIFKKLLGKISPRPTSFSNCLDKVNNNPLHLAVSASCYESVKLILNNEFVSDASDLIVLYNNDGKTPYDIAYENGDDGLLEMFDKYEPLPTPTDLILLSKYESFIVRDDVSDSIKDFYIALALDALYGSSIVNNFNRDDIYSDLKINKYTTNIVKDRSGNYIEVTFSNNKILLDYIETALRLYGVYTKTSDVGLYDLLVSKFVVNNTALNIGDDIPLIDHKCYAILNALHIADNIISKNNAANKNAIIEAVNNGNLNTTNTSDAELFSSCLLGWRWFENNQ